MKPRNIYRCACVCMCACVYVRVCMCTCISSVPVPYVYHYFELTYSTVARLGLHNSKWSPCPVPWVTILWMSAVLQMGFWDSGRGLMRGKCSKSGRRETRRSMQMRRMQQHFPVCVGETACSHPRWGGGVPGKQDRIGKSLHFWPLWEIPNAWHPVQGYAILEIKQSIALA